MLCKEVRNYISTAKGLPFFYVVGDEDYGPVLEELKQADISIVRMSDFCLRDDKFPSVDELVDYFRTSDVDYRDNRFVVVGLGDKTFGLVFDKEAVAVFVCNHDGFTVVTNYSVG